MEETYDFPTIAEAAGTGTVPEAMAVLARPAMTAELGRARALAAKFGPNAAPIRVSPDGRVTVLEANNEIYWAKDGSARFKHVPGVAKGPVMSADGAHLAYGSGAGTYHSDSRRRHGAHALTDAFAPQRHVDVRLVAAC